MTTSVPREHAVDDVSPSDPAFLRKCLRTILTHLVALHVDGKHADALFVGVKSAALHVHFDGVVESALEAIEVIADRLRALDPHYELNRRTRVEGCSRPSRPAATAADAAIDDAMPTADQLICRIRTVRTVIRAVHNRIRDEDPLTAALLCRIDLVLETRAVTLQNLSVDAERSSS
jgi:DNA-binding ferritin-like protein